MAADAGRTVLIVELEGKSGISAAFGLDEDLGYEEVELQAARAAAAGAAAPCAAGGITPDDALMEYLEDHGLRRVSKRLARSGVLDVVSTAIPGIRDVLVLGKVKQLEREGRADLIVVDAPATGHAITFLTSASGLVNAARGGPLRTQAQDVVDLLSDPTRCRVILVTLPEELPVSETIESAYTLEDKAGVQLGPVIVNACDPEPVGLDRPAARSRPRRAMAVAPRPSWPLWRRPGASDWNATPSPPPRSSGWPTTCRLPHLLVPRSAPTPIGPSRPQLWPRAGLAATAWTGCRRTRRAIRDDDGRDCAGRCRRRWPTGHERRGHRLLRLGRGGQDDGLRHLRTGGGPGGPAGLRGHRRPGPAAGRRAGRAVAGQHARPR